MTCDDFTWAARGWLGERITQARKKAGVSAEDLAKLTDSTIADVEGWQRGEIEGMSVPKLNKIATICDTDMDALFFGAERNNSVGAAKVLLTWRELKIIAALRCIDFPKFMDLLDENGLAEEKWTEEDERLYQARTSKGAAQ
jgi:transcriptional regulator with XRE-family HTH domain